MTVSNPHEPALRPEPQGRREYLWLLTRLAALGLAVAATTIGIVVMLPDGNDYSLATELKHARLDQAPGPKIVFVGGSSLAYGLDSQPIEVATGRSVVNMGMNGFLGVRFMLEEVKPALKAGDVVVLAFEYDSLFLPADGDPASLLMLATTRPATLQALTWKQKAGVLGVVPLAAQQKVTRLMRKGGAAARRAALALLGRPDESGSEVLPPEKHALAITATVETFASFDDHGDLNGHVGVTWPYHQGDSVDLTHTPIDPDVVDIMAAFARDMNGRGVKVVVSYCPSIRYYYEEHRERLAALHEALKDAGLLILSGPPDRMAFPEELFFDTVYHLNERGRVVRTARVIADLQTMLAPSARQ